VDALKSLCTPLPLQKGDLLLGTVADFKPKPYGVVVDLGDGMTGFLPINMISNERFEYGNLESILHRDEKIKVGL
jgi:ribosomal protein S1